MKGVTDLVHRTALVLFWPFTLVVSTDQLILPSLPGYKIGKTSAPLRPGPQASVVDRGLGRKG